jgi:hypothetical protein
METALRVIGAFFAIDLIAAVVLAILVQIISRREPVKGKSVVIVGLLFFFAIALSFIYAGLWMCSQVRE